MKWIPVTERLPAEGGRYWCYLSHVDDLGISHFQWNCCYNEDTKTFSDRTLTDGEIVTHWMPLQPAPDASLPSSSVTGEEVNVYAGALNTERIKAYRNISQEYNIQESTVRDIFCKGIDWYKKVSFLPVTGESEAIEFAEWKEKNYRGNGPLYYHVDDSLKSITVTHYYNIPELYKIYKKSNPESEAIGEMKFTLKEALDIWEAAIDHHVSVSDFDCESLPDKETYFLNKFGINL